MSIAKKQTSVAAVVSLISGILGLTVLPLIASITAVIAGHIGRANIRKNPQALEGDGLAVAGLVLGYLMIGIAILSIVVIFLFFGSLAALLLYFGIDNLNV